MNLYIGIRNCNVFRAAAAALTVSTSLQAQTPVTAHVTPSADHVTIGDRITLRFRIDHPRGMHVLWPDSLPNIAPFEQQSARVEAPEDSVQSGADYVVAAFELGDLTFPPITFEVVGPSGDTTQVASEALPIVIASVGLDGSEDIRGIKPPLDIPLSWVTIALWAGAAALLLSGAWLVYRRLTRRTGPARPARAVTPTRPAHVIAYEALDRLAQSSMLERQEIERWYLEVSRIIREYIEGRYGVAAMEMASNDIMNALEPCKIEYRALDQFRDFFARADLVKFAKHRPSVDACRALLQSARALVDHTREPDVPVTSSDAPNTSATAA